MSRKPDREWEPALGYEDFDEEVTVRVSTNQEDGSRSAVLLPASIRRLNPEQYELVHQAQKRSLQAQQLRAEIDELALEMRDAGVSWAAIGWSTGLTGEAARKRWADA